MNNILEHLTGIFSSRCDQPASIANFDAAAYMGTWYEQQRVKGLWFEPDNSVCVQAQYLDLKTDSHFVVRNSMQDVDFNKR